MRAREFTVREQASAVDNAVRGARDIAGAAELASVATQAPKVPIPAMVKKIGGKVLPGANVAYQTLDAVNRAKMGDPIGATIAGAAAVPHPYVALPAIGVQAVRDKYRTGSFFPDDAELEKAVQKDRAERGQRPLANISDTPAP